MTYKIPALTMQQAADILNVSHVYMVGLLASGEVPSRRSGGRYLIRRDVLMSYKNEDDARRRAVADELTQLSQE